MVLSVLIKYPFQTKESNKVFFKKQELINLNWPQQGGWFDTDGYITFNYNKKNKHWQKRAGLKLSDRQPVELFSKIFKTSLTYHESTTWTPKPYRKEYLCKQYIAEIRGDKAIWFTKNVYPYLIKEEKKDFAAELLGYRPKSKDFADWTPDEVVHYLATALEGDGQYYVHQGKRNKTMEISLHSSHAQYLSDVQNLAQTKLGLILKMQERSTYETQKGIRTKYVLRGYCSLQNPENLGFFQSLAKEGVMTLDRKKQRVQEFLNFIL
tara:strand:+ start:110 stop:907 length:798 start_codon:yes stop_codon:yes gene_type:complete